MINGVAGSHRHVNARDAHGVITTEPMHGKERNKRRHDDNAVAAQTSQRAGHSHISIIPAPSLERLASIHRSLALRRTHIRADVGGSRFKHGRR